MSNCGYCEGPLGKGDVWRHDKCSAEYNRRLAARECTYCGGPNCITIICPKCSAMDDPPRCGYPPEA